MVFHNRLLIGRIEQAEANVRIMIIKEVDMANTKFVLGGMNQFFQLVFLKGNTMNVQIDRQIKVLTPL